MHKDTDQPVLNDPGDPGSDPGEPGPKAGLHLSPVGPTGAKTLRKYTKGLRMLYAYLLCFAGTTALTRYRHGRPGPAEAGRPRRASRGGVLD